MGIQFAVGAMESGSGFGPKGGDCLFPMCVTERGRKPFTQRIK